MFDNLDYELLEFPDQTEKGDEYWIRVELREPRSVSRPYGPDKHSVYLAMWAGSPAGVYLTAQKARKLATILLTAADFVDKDNMGE